MMMMMMMMVIMMMMMMMILIMMMVEGFPVRLHVAEVRSRVVGPHLQDLQAGVHLRGEMLSLFAPNISTYKGKLLSLKSWLLAVALPATSCGPS